MRPQKKELAPKGSSQIKKAAAKGSLEKLEPKLPAMEPVSLIDGSFARSLSRSGAQNEMGHKRNHCKKQQQMNQSAGYVEHQKATGPQNEQQQSNH